MSHLNLKNPLSFVCFRLVDQSVDDEILEELRDIVSRADDEGTFATKRNIVFRENKTITEFLDNQCLGNLYMFGMNITKTQSETSLKSPVLVKTATECNTSTFFCPSTKEVGELDDVRLHPLAQSPRMHSLSDCTLYSCTDNEFYLENEVLSETIPKQHIHPPDDTVQEFVTGKPDAFDSMTDTCTNKHSGILTRQTKTPFQYLGSFESCRHAKACTIPALTVLQNGSIVLVDHYHSKIQLFDKEFTFIAETIINYPVGICAINAYTVAVSQRRDSKIAFLQIDSQGLTKIKEVTPCHFYLWQIACKADNLFVLCDENNVHVMNTDGSAAAMINTGVKTEMGFVRHFDVSDDAQRVFLCERSALRCISSSGETLWRITDDHLPVRDRCSQQLLFEDVCIFNNYIFGSMWKAGKIALINMDGELEQYVVTSGLDYPCAMAVGSGNLFVAQFSPSHTPLKTRTIKMFSSKLLKPNSDKRM